MARTSFKLLSLLFLFLALGVGARAQTATYRLHKEASTTTGLFQLKTAAPDGTSLAIQSANLKGVAAGEYLVKAFDTQAGVPGSAGTIPAGSTVSFSVWMRKTTTGGTLFPRARLRLNGAAGTVLATATGATALTSTLAKYTFTATTTTAVTMTAADRLYVWVGVNLTAAPTTNTTAELDIEGTAGGNYDSTVTVPLPSRPTVSGISPAAGPVGTSVTVSGSNFGATQGTSTITFNGTAATVTSWGAGTIVAPVPAGATTGPVVVTVNGAASTGQTFTVADVGGFNGTVSRVTDGAPIAGAQVRAIQAGVVKGTATSGAGGAYTLSGLLAGTYDLQATATGYETQVQTAQQVTAQTSTAVNFALGSVFITYIYDELGRLVGAVDPNGDTARYAYDAAGNLTSISRQSSSQISVVEFSPNSGPIGTTVTVYGTGFGSTPAQNSVKFNGVAATVTSATSTRLVATVPAGATTGPITVTTSAGTGTSTAPFVVGNSTVPTITGFTPNVGSAGASVTITGTNFQSVPSNNKVAFNGIRASVTGATATSIVAVVPAGASSGRLSVSTPEGKAVSADDFYIPPHPFAGTDVESTGRISFGETKTVAVTSPNKIVMLLFDGTAGQRMSLHMYNGSMGWAQVSIISPDGSHLIGPTWTVNGGFFDTRALPATGTYSIVVDPENANTGSLTLTLYDMPPDSASSVTPGGPSASVSTTTPGQNARFTFGGSAGQRVSFSLSGSMGWALISIVNPDGSYLMGPSWISGGGYFDTRSLPTAGTYSIVVDPENANTGGMNLSLYDVPPDAANTITPGGPSASASTTTPGQNARFTFEGNANQRVSLSLGGSMGWALISIVNPDGTYLMGPSWIAGGGYFDTRVLPATGTYTIVVDPENANTGSITLTLHEVAPDATGTVTAGGPSTTVTTTTAGQNARVTFDGNAGQRISLALSGSMGWALISIVNPDGSHFMSPTWIAGGGYFDVRTLPAAGTYTIVIDPENANTGSMTVTLYDVPPDPTASITAGGPSSSVSTTTPGQIARVTFGGSAAQRISLGLSGTMGWAQISIINPDGTYLMGPSWIAGGGYFDTRALPVTGTYTIVVDPENANTGSMTLTLYDVPPDPVSAITAGGPSVTVSTTTPGQNARLTFDGTANQKISLGMTGSMGWALVSIVKPDGSYLIGPTWTVNGGSFGATVLPADGAYTIVVDPENANTGSMTLTLNNVP